MAEGEKLGLLVGSFDGDANGCTEGVAVGSADGDALGLLTGWLDGDTDGLVEGDELGLLVG